LPQTKHSGSHRVFRIGLRLKRLIERLLDFKRKAAREKFVIQGRTQSLSDLYESVKERAVQRIRPKIMTVCAILFGLLPIMWSPATQAGADVMKRIATPMIGGVITSAILELLIYPVIYVLWRKRSLPKSALQINGQLPFRF
jgi:Cu/Ag efflux pump CusA